jgi:hypothetical protein
VALHLDPHEHDPEDHGGRERIEPEEVRRTTADASVLATGSLICPGCELPISVGAGVPAISELVCPFCDHAGEARAFLRRDVSDTRANRVDLVARIV